MDQDYRAVRDRYVNVLDGAVLIVAHCDYAIDPRYFVSKVCPERSIRGVCYDDLVDWECDDFTNLPNSTGVECFGYDFNYGVDRGVYSGFGFA